MFRAIRRALISVSNKTGLLDLAKAMAQKGVEIISTGGTAKLLRDGGLTVMDISELTGFPEMLDGRVKTLHPKVHGGLLGRRDLPDHQKAMAEQNIVPIDLVVVNLYPFETVASKPDAGWDELIENIDIGGPSMIRSAAKNHESVVVLSDPDQYDSFLATYQLAGGTDLPLRKRFALEAFQRTAAYDCAIAKTLGERLAQGGEGLFPNRLTMTYTKVKNLRYGENPQQKAAFYRDTSQGQGTASAGTVIHGKELSYNNLLDLDGATRLAGLLEDPAAVVVKHTNPCGAAAAATVAEAVATALAADPASAFGSIIAVNRTFDRACAEILLAPGLFVEVIAAPAFEQEAVELLTTRPTWKASVRLVEVPAGDPWEATGGLELRSIAGAVLAQRPDVACDDPATWRVVTRVAPAPALTQALDFAFTIVRRLTSNAIAVCQGTSLVGAGIGQTSRVDAVRIALEKAGNRMGGAVLASDAFFPFPDSIELIARAGIAAVIQPGGSKRDAEVIAAADAAGIPMVFTSRRHFRH